MISLLKLIKRYQSETLDSVKENNYHFQPQKHKLSFEWINSKTFFRRDLQD